MRRKRSRILRARARLSSRPSRMSEKAFASRRWWIHLGILWGSSKTPTSLPPLHKQMRTVLLLILLCGCAPAIQSSRSQSIVTERLYFGRNIGDTLGVSDSVWAVFVRDVVSARLPAGFTFWPAEGAWRDSTGRRVREPSFVLEVVHPARSAGADSAIVAIIAEYKHRFSQQSVLRVVTAGRTSF